jgi:DNA end-binding protein Ku
MLDLATHIVSTKSGHFDPAQFEDRYETALVELLKKKEAGEKIEPAKAGPAPRVVKDALRASLDAAGKKAPAPSVQARRPAKKKAGQK